MAKITLNGEPMKFEEPSDQVKEAIATAERIDAAYQESLRRILRTWPDVTEEKTEFEKAWERLMNQYSLPPQWEGGRKEVVVRPHPSLCIDLRPPVIHGYTNFPNRTTVMNEWGMDQDGCEKPIIVEQE